MQELARIHGQLGRIGNLLNQLAKVANGTGNLPATHTLSAVAANIADMRRATHAALAGGKEGNGNDHQDQ